MKNIPEFHGLRGYLSIFVLIAHVYYPVSAWALGSMDMFFALSAFLIGGGVIRQQARPGFYKSYIRRRILRIWPNYYLLFFISLGLAFLSTKFGIHPHQWFPVPETFQDFFFVQRTERWFCYAQACEHANYSPYLVHTWSLAIEEQFYVLVLPVVWLITRYRNPTALLACLAAFLLPLEATLRFFGASEWTLIGRLDPFVMGLLLAFIMSEPSTTASRKFMESDWIYFYLGLSFVPAIALYGLFPPGTKPPIPALYFIFPPSIFSIFAFFLLASIRTHTMQRGYAFLRWKLWTGLGEMSYSTYLWHLPVIMASGILQDRYHLARDWKVLIPEFFISLAVGWVAFVLVENPMRRFGRNQTSVASAGVA